MEHPASHVESHWRTQLRNHIIQASSLLEILLSGLVLIGLLLSAVPLIRWMPGLLIDGNEVEIRTFLERSLDIVIGIEFIKMLAKHSPGSSLEVLLYAIARHLVVGHDSALENLLSVGAIALIFIVRKYFFVPAFGAHLPDGHLAPDLSPAQSGIHWLHPEPETLLGIDEAADHAVAGIVLQIGHGVKGGVQMGVDQTRCDKPVRTVHELIALGDFNGFPAFHRLDAVVLHQDHLIGIHPLFYCVEQFSTEYRLLHGDSSPSIWSCGSRGQSSAQYGMNAHSD